MKGGSTKFNYKITGTIIRKKVSSPIRTSTVTESVPIWVMRLRRSSICMSGSMQRWVLRDPEVETRCSRPVWPVGASASSLLPPPSIYSASNAALELDGGTKYDKRFVRCNINMNYQLPWNIRWNVTAGYIYNNTENEKFTPGMLNSNQAQLYGLSKYSDRLYGRTSLSYSGSTGILKYGLTVTGEISSNRSNGNEIKQTGLVNDYLWGPLGLCFIMG